MKDNKYIYNVNYQNCEEDLCFMEIKSLFEIDLKEKVFFTNKSIDPSRSPFIKARFEIMYEASSLDEILEIVKDAEIEAKEFKVKYLLLYSEDEHFKKRRELCMKIGLLMKGSRSFSEVKVNFGITNYKGLWYFGTFIKNDNLWKEHNSKPYSYSSSLNINIAKALINIASDGDLSKRLVDPCCGVGTVLLEGLISGYKIKGYDISRKVSWNAKRNVIHFNYETDVKNLSIVDINEKFDAAIVDLPYGISSETSEKNQIMIIKNARRISNKVVLVSCVDISKQLLDLDLNIISKCEVRKNKNRLFARYIWVVM